MRAKSHGDDTLLTMITTINIDLDGPPARRWRGAIAPHEQTNTKSLRVQSSFYTPPHTLHSMVTASSGDPHRPQNVRATPLGIREDAIVGRDPPTLPYGCD